MFDQIVEEWVGANLPPEPIVLSYHIRSWRDHEYSPDDWTWTRIEAIHPEWIGFNGDTCYVLTFESSITPTQRLAAIDFFERSLWT